MPDLITRTTFLFYTSLLAKKKYESTPKIGKTRQIINHINFQPIGFDFFKMSSKAEMNRTSHMIPNISFIFF